MTEMTEPISREVVADVLTSAGYDGEDVSRFFERVEAEGGADALNSAANYFAGGLHCMDMRSTPEETVQYLICQSQKMRSNDE